MKDQLITFKTAKLLGLIRGAVDFTNARDWYNSSGVLHGYSPKRPHFACTQSTLQKWLREKHGRHIVIIPTVTSDWTFKVVRVIAEVDSDVISGIKSIDSLPPYEDVHGYDYRTYEDALEAAMYIELKIIVK